MQTLADLIARNPRKVSEERNVGRKTIAAFRAAIREELGTEWDALWLQRQHARGERPDGWDALATHIPAPVLETPLARIPLNSARIRAFIRVEGLTTLRELLALPEEQLTQLPNIGAITLADSRDDILNWLERPPLELDEPGAFWTTWRERLGWLRRREADAILRRSGLDGPPLTLVELGNREGVTRERIRQLEEHGLSMLRRDPWVPQVHQRVLDALEGGVLPLVELESRCPCLAPLSEDRHLALAYFLTRVAESPLIVTELGGQKLIVACSANELERSAQRARAAVKALPMPAEAEEVRQAIASAAPVDAPGLARFLGATVEPRIRHDERGRMLAYGNTRNARLMAFLRQCPEPVPAHEITAALGARYASYPPEVFYFNHGLIGLEKHFPNFRRWRELLAPPSVRILKRDRRQWRAQDVLAALSEDHVLPAWFTHWHLAEVLRRTPEVRYLGRLLFALPTKKPKKRALYSDLVRDFLVARGGPVSDDELYRHMLRHTTFSRSSLHLMVLRPPFFRVDEGRTGLLPRDVPGGPEAMAAFGDALATELQRRQEGFTKEEFRAYADEVAPADWTFQMAVSAARADPRFRLARAGGLQVGLARWENPRVTSRAMLVRACVEEHGGKAPVKAVMKRLHARYPTPDNRAGLWALVVVQCGMTLEGDWVVSRERRTR